MAERPAIPSSYVTAETNGIPSSGMASPPAIQAIALTKEYGTLRAVEDVNFSVARGEVVGFLGPNGAGKSTTMRILSGLLAATTGRAYVAGIPVAARPEEVKRRLGYMPENNPLPEDLRVIEYLRFRARLKEIPRKKVNERVDEVMDVCGLHRKTRRRIIGTLSKGYRQRVGIAEAILAEPEVILMDEPTIGLDPHQILGIRRLIDSLRGRMTIMLSSHILPEIEMCCDRVIIINKGRIVAEGTSSVLRAKLFAHSKWRLRLGGDIVSFERRLPELAPRLFVTTRGLADANGFTEFHLQGPQDDTSAGEDLLNALIKDGQWRVREFAHLDPSLEDIFLAATHHGNDDSFAPIPRFKK